MLPISEQYLNSPCEVRTMENSPLLMGYISRFVEDGIEIVSKDDRLPLIHCNTMAKISIMNGTLGFKILIGRVYLSTVEFIRIVDLQNVMDFEKRNFFRVRVNLPAKAFPVAKTDASSEPAPIRKPLAAVVRDISLSGLLFLSDQKLELGDQLIVSLDLHSTGISLLSKIVRECPGTRSIRFGYGCEYLDNTGKQFDVLCKYLFDCQREQVQIMRQYADREK